MFVAVFFFLLASCSGVFAVDHEPILGPGAIPVTPHEFPFLAVLRIADYPFCGGILVSEYTVLTMASCIEAVSEIDEIFTVQVGMHEIETWEENPFRRVAKVPRGGSPGPVPPGQIGVFYSSVHPCYDGYGYGHDIGLIYLDTKVEQNDTIRVVPKIANWKKHEMAHESDNCYVMGYGLTVNLTTNEPLFPTTPYKYNVHITEEDECYQWLVDNNMTDFPYHNASFCDIQTAGPDLATPCIFDWGNPMVCDLRGKGIYTVVGVLNYLDCDSLFSGYANLELYHRWIRQLSNFYENWKTRLMEKERPSFDRRFEEATEMEIIANCPDLLDRRRARKEKLKMFKN